jgi:hypothetical protein
MSLSPRARFLKVIHDELPDRVPVMPGYGTWYATRIVGGDLFDLEEGRLSAGRILSDITRKYGCEMWFWEGYADDIAEVENDGKIISNTSEKEVIDADNYIVTSTLTTPSGILTSQTQHNRYNPPQTVTGMLKDPARDWPILRESAGDHWSWSDHTTMLDIPPEDLELGITSFAYALPVDYWKGVRGDTVSAINDLSDDLPAAVEALEWYEEYCYQKLAARLAISPLPDMLHLGGSSSSLSVISPAIYRHYNLHYINRLTDLAHQYDIPVQIHHCGKSRKLVDIVANETPVDIMHPLEPPPGGDVDIAEVKRLYGDRLILNGNLNTYQLMLFATPAQVKAAARKCIEDAGAGGRFILCTGDQIGRDTPEANVMAMVEAAYEYGRYT